MIIRFILLVQLLFSTNLCFSTTPPVNNETSHKKEIDKIAELIRSNPKRVEIELTKVLEKIYQTPDSTDICNSFRRLGGIFAREARFYRARHFYFEAENYINTNTAPLVLRTIYSDLGNVHMDLRDNETAINYFNRALEVQTDPNESEDTLLGAYLGMATSYTELGEDEKCTQYFEKALDVANTTQSHSAIGFSSFNYGIYCLENNRFERADFLLKVAKTNFSFAKDSSNVLLVDLQFGRMYSMEKRYREAERILNRGLKHCEERKYQMGELLFAGELGVLETKRENYTLADLYLKRKYTLAKEIQHSSSVQEVLSNWIELKEKVGDYESAFTLKSEYHTLKDSIFNSEKTEQLAAMYAQFETNERTKELNKVRALKEKDDELFQQELTHKNSWIIFSVVLIIVLILIAMQYRSLFRTKSKAASTKSMLLSEMNHRVKNNLQLMMSLMQIQSRSVKDESAREILLRNSDRIQTLGLIYSALSPQDDVADVKMKHYMGMLISRIFEAVGPDDLSEIRIEKEIDNIEVPVDKAIFIGLILNELIHNACKHAFPFSDNPKMKIRLRHDQNSDQLRLEVSDSGPGTNAKSKGSGLGNKLIANLVSQLKGESSYTREKGLHFSLLVPNFKS